MITAYWSVSGQFGESGSQIDPDLGLQVKKTIYLFSASREGFRAPAVASNPSISSKRYIFDFFCVSFLSSWILDLESIQSGSKTILAEHFRVKIRTKATAWIRICEKYYYDDIQQNVSLYLNIGTNTN